MFSEEKGMCEGKYDIFGMYIWPATIKKDIKGWLRKKQRLEIYDNLTPERRAFKGSDDPGSGCNYWIFSH